MKTLDGTVGPVGAMPDVRIFASEGGAWSTSTNPLVSVVIPTYNRSYCITAAVDSVLAQTHRNAKVIVVDDGSTDGTAQVIADKYGYEPRVQYVYQRNAGVSAARNTGFSLAEGDYIALLDSDDLWDPWKLELQLAAFSRRPDIGMVWTDMRAINSEGDLVSHRYLREMYSAHKWFPTSELFPWSCSVSELLPLPDATAGEARFYAGDIFSQMIAGNLVHTSTVLLRRDRVEKVGGMKVEYSQAGEDYEFYLRTCREGPVGFLDLPSITYQKGRQDQVTTTCGLPIARNFLRTIEAALAEDSDRITLPPELINKILADAHRWLGCELIRANELLLGRKYLFHGLRREFEAYAFRCLLLSFVPQTLVHHLKAGLAKTRALPKVRMLAMLILAYSKIDIDMSVLEVLDGLEAIAG